MWKPDIIIYHYPCDDGFGSALCAYLKWGNDIEYHGAAYGSPPPDVVGKNVLIADFSYPAETLGMMAAAGGAKSIIVLDHHKTAEEALREYTTPLKQWSIEDVNRDDDEGVYVSEFGPAGCNILAQFDMDRSGARLTWDFLFPGVDVPWMIKLIEDRDLWRFQYPQTKPFSQYLRSLPFDLDKWAGLCHDMETGELRQSIIKSAEAIQRFFDRKVEEVAEQARWVDIAGYTVPVVNANWTFSSDVCHRLLELHPEAPFAASYFDTKDNMRQFSLRSTDEREDVSQIAKVYGGGGHRNAAGFSALGGWYLSPPSAMGSK